jgi:hypothetical protein
MVPAQGLVSTESGSFTAASFEKCGMRLTLGELHLCASRRCSAGKI